MNTTSSPELPFLPFARPDIDETELAEVTDCLASGWLTTGPKVKRFESLLAEYVGAKHAVAVNSATAAMHLALEAIGTSPGDLVFVPAYTFTATAEVVRYFDAIPVLVDSDPDDLNLSPTSLAHALDAASSGALVMGDGRRPLPANGSLRAIMPVHLAGQPACMDSIYELAAKYDLSVVEDAAHALPSRYRGRLIGATPQGWSLPASGNGQPALHTPPVHATCFSFYATKTLATGEGGMLLTDNDAVAERCRVMSLHGIDRDGWKRYSAEGNWYYEVLAPGFKYNLTDLAAALGIAQFAKLERMWRRRCEIADQYSRAFSELSGYLQTPTTRPEVQHAWHLYLLRLNVAIDQDEQAYLGGSTSSGIASWQPSLRISRADFIKALRQRGIGASVHFIPLHLHPYYRDRYGYRPADFPIAYQNYQRAVSLPIYSSMSDVDVQRVIEAVTDLVMAHRV